MRKSAVGHLSKVRLLCGDEGGSKRQSLSLGEKSVVKGTQNLLSTIIITRRKPFQLVSDGLYFLLY